MKEVCFLICKHGLTDEQLKDLRHFFDVDWDIPDFEEKERFEVDGDIELLEYEEGVYHYHGKVEEGTFQTFSNAIEKSIKITKANFESWRE